MQNITKLNIIVPTVNHFASESVNLFCSRKTSHVPDALLFFLFFYTIKTW